MFGLSSALKALQFQVTTTNWKDPNSKISKYFTVGEATLLPSWAVYHTTTSQEKADIIATAVIMDKIRDFLGAPIRVHCWIRPTYVDCTSEIHEGENYNHYVGGALHSAHILGRAVDFHVDGLTCDQVRAKLLPRLQEFGIRMENNPGSNWVHIDTYTAPEGSRYFRV